MTAKSEFKVSMEDRKQTYVIIPAYNEETRVRPVIEAIADMGFKIILVNDGSSDGTLDVLKDVQMKYPENIFIYSHVINRGVGLAMQTGFEAVLKHNPKYIVNIDADGHDMDNILLVDTTTIRSIPKNTVGDIASRDVVSLKVSSTLKEAAEVFAFNDIKGAPVMEDGKAVGVFTVTDLVRAIANNKEDLLVGDLMTTNIVIVNEDMRIANAIEIMLKKAISRVLIADNDNNLLGIVTRTDLINSITNLSQFPIITQ